MFQNLLFVIRTFAIFIALSVACFLMLQTVVGYADFRNDVQFLLQKQDYLDNPVWKTAFYIHVFSAIGALLAGFTQFSKELQREHRRWHRFFGKTYAWNIMAINFPAGMIMAIYANGHLPGKTAFIVLDVLWFWFTFKAVRCAQAKDFVGHKNNMIRSYALTCSAITLRTWKLILSSSFTIDPAQLYIIDAWLGFVPNLLLAEWLIRGSGRRQGGRPVPHGQKKL